MDNTAKPDVDAELLLAYLDYARWATVKMLDTAGRLPSSALTEPVVSSFPTLLATLRHAYGWDAYYSIHLQGGHAERGSIREPDCLEELRSSWTGLHRDLASWARDNLATRKDAVLEGWGVWPTWMVILHMVNHAVHHFGQVVTLVRQLGYPSEPVDSTDLIRYLLRRYPQEHQKEFVKSFLDRDTTPLTAVGGGGNTGGAVRI